MRKPHLFAGRLFTGILIFSDVYLLGHPSCAVILSGEKEGFFSVAYCFLRRGRLDCLVSSQKEYRGHNGHHCLCFIFNLEDVTVAGDV